MRTDKHLTRYQLIAYNSGTLEKCESESVGKHLLMCPGCRKSLPLPSVERFWSVILTENSPSDNPAEEKSGNLFSPVFSAFSAFSSAWNLHSNLIWSGAALGILLSFSFLIWLNFALSPKEVAQSFEINNDSVSELDFPLPQQSPVDNKRESSNKGSAAVAPTPKKLKAKLPKSKSSAETGFGQNSEQKISQKQNRISETRGVSAGCKEEESVELELSTEKENFVFKWKKVPKAAKYHLYISDDDEILIDEFETEKETTFILKKPLDPLKTYQWKVIVTLENGQTVAGASNKFTIKDFQNEQMKPEKKRSSAIRCSAIG